MRRDLVIPEILPTKFIVRGMQDKKPTMVQIPRKPTVHMPWLVIVFNATLIVKTLEPQASVRLRMRPI